MLRIHYTNYTNYMNTTSILGVGFHLHTMVLQIIQRNLFVNQPIHPSDLLHLTDGRFLERKICNPLVNVADRLKKLRSSGQPYLVNVKIVLM